jgi:hypothetical protein
VEASVDSQSFQHQTPTTLVVTDSIAAVERLSPYVTLEWLFDRNAFAICVADGTRATTDVWFNAVKRIALSWPINKPFISMYDFHYRNIAMSPYARSRSEMLSNLRPELQAWTAVSLQSALAAQIAQFFVNRQKRDSLVARVFPRREPALTWLRQIYEESYGIIKPID